MIPNDADTTADNAAFLSQAYHRLRQAISDRRTEGDGTLPTLPHAAAITAARDALPRLGDPRFLTARGPEATMAHIRDAIVPGLNNQSLSSRYYGFVTGGVLPVAEAADNIVTALDANVSVHMPAHSASTSVEDAALTMVVALLDLGEPRAWLGRTFTTGATASNTMGLACGRQAVIMKRLPTAAADVDVADVGLLAACRAAGVREIQVLTSMGHSSLAKAASVVGLGHRAVKELPASHEEPWRLDLDAVERELAREGVASIIVVSAGEVNTGRFATNVFDMPKLRSLADRYGAWIHVDGGMCSFYRPTASKPWRCPSSFAIWVP